MKDVDSDKKYAEATPLFYSLDEANRPQQHLAVSAILHRSGRHCHPQEASMNRSVTANLQSQLLAMLWDRLSKTKNLAKVRHIISACCSQLLKGGLFEASSMALSGVWTSGGALGSSLKGPKLGPKGPQKVSAVVFL